MDMITSNTSKSFFQRPEGNTGLFVMCAGGVGAAFGLYHFLPYLIELMKNLYIAIAMGTGLFAIIALLMNDRFRATIWYMYKALMSWITGVFVAVDPIGILKSHIEDMKEKLDQVNNSISDVRGQRQKLTATISERTSEMEKSLKISKRAKDANDEETFIIQSRKAARAQESIGRFQMIVERMDKMLVVLDSMRKKANILLEDTVDLVEQKESEYNTIKAAYKAMNGVKKMLFGDNRREIFEEGLRFIADDIGFKLGEMEDFMERSKDFMKSLDYEDGMFSEKGMEMLAEWEEKGTSHLLETQKGDLIKVATGALNVQLPRADYQVVSSAPAKSTDNAYKGYF